MLFLIKYIRFYKFLFVGILVMLVGYVVLNILIEKLKVNKDLAYLIQAIITVELNFILNAVLTWGDLLKKKHSLKIIGKWFLAFNLSRLLINNPTAQILFWIITTIEVEYSLAYFISIILNTPLTYLTSKHLVYRK